MRPTCFLLALLFFVAASIIDRPWPRPPSQRERFYGNFCCSMGFVFLTIALSLTRP